MKKHLFFATALAALVSCSSDDFVGETQQVSPSREKGAIVFGTGVKTVTRAEQTGADAATLLNNEFVFAGTKGTSPTTFVFDQYVAKYVANTAYTTESNTNNWEYVSYTPASTSSLGSGAEQTIKYWDYSTTQYDFAAYSLGKGVEVTPATDPKTYTYASPSKIAAGNKSYTLQGTADQLKACYISDLVTIYNYNGGTTDNTSDDVSDYGKPVQFHFRSLGAKVRLALYETIPGYSVKDVKFYTSSTATSTQDVSDTENKPTLFASTAVLPSGSGTMNVSFTTTGWDNKAETDYNKAHVTFTPTNSATDLSTKLEFGALADFAAAEKKETTGNIYIGRASNAATYAGGLVSTSGKYYTVLPYETGANLTLRIKYTLVSLDNSGEEIVVDKASAVIPAELTRWNPNYAYTYIFKLSDMTNGSTGVDGSGNIVTGLTPITLDAVVVDSEDGVQETITTVSTPSITTYTKGEVVTTKNEYETAANIYIIVNNGTSNVTLTPGTNAWLYTATVETGAFQTISEASVGNALAKGSYNSAAKTYTVTDANSKALVVTDVTASKQTTATTEDLFSAISSIPAEDSPTGNAITVTGAKFYPEAAGTYVFRYQKAAPTYDSGTVLASGTSLNGYYTMSGTVYTQCNSADTADGTTTYYKVTTPGEYQYKIIKVVTN